MQSEAKTRNRDFVKKNKTRGVYDSYEYLNLAYETKRQLKPGRKLLCLSFPARSGEFFSADSRGKAETQDAEEQTKGNTHL